MRSRRPAPPEYRVERSCLLTANSSEAKFFETARGGKVRFLARISCPAGRLHGRELVSDRPGRSFASARGSGLRHGLERKLGMREEEIHAFCKKIARRTDELLHDGRFDGITLVADPHLLGLLRRCFSANSRRRISREIQGDWTKLTDLGLSARIRALKRAA
jgi:protein required for attachment to host cells